MPSSAVPLRLEGVSKRLGGRRILQGLDLEVGHGKTVALLGANGSGKTTLLRLAAGISRPDAGQVRVGGHDPTTEGEAARASCSLLLQDPPLYGDLSAREHLLWWARMHPTTRRPQSKDGASSPAFQAVASDRAASAQTWLESASLLHAADKPVATLSRGQRQRLAIAMAFQPEASLLLLDEPFSHLDDQGHAWLEGLVASRRQDAGLATLMALHDMDLARRLADSRVRLCDGRLEAA